MITHFKNFINRLLLIGVEDGLSHIAIYQIKNANFGGLISFIFAIISTFATSFYIPSPYIIVPIVGSLGYLLALVFNYFHIYSLANINTWGISLLMFFWMAGAYGESSNAYLLLIIVEMMAVLNFEAKNKWIYVTTTLPIIAAVISYATHFSLFLIPNLSEVQLAHINPILYFAVIIGCAVTVWTHRSQVQEQVQQLEEKYHELEKTNDKLHQTNEELDRFVYSVSHDLRAPITSVMGLVDLCETDKANIDQYLLLQRKSMNKLDNFIKDILHYARNARLDIKPSAVDLVAIIKDCFETQKYAQSAEDFHLEIQVKGNTTIYSDEFRLNIILANIISNAIRYRKPKANSSFIRFEIHLNEKVTKIAISDNGIGIPAKHIPHIFQMFYRANSKSTGSGLGLYIVKEAVNKLKGIIEVNSEEGKGTTFHLTIPNLLKS